MDNGRDARNVTTLPLKLLFVEDSEDDYDLVLLHLRRRGHQVSAHRVEDEQGLRAALAAGPWDAILSDYNLPRFDCIEALRIAAAEAPYTAFVIVSGHIGEDAAVEVMRHGASDYLLKNKERLDYATALANGWPIATGIIEGACRHLVKDRMDLTGARWSLDGAEAVLRLRSLRASGDFEEYMAFHHRQERQRNYGPAPQNEDIKLAA